MSAQPRFLAVFKPTRMIARSVDKGVIDIVMHVGYDSTGQRWGFVERVTGRSGTCPPYRPETRVARGWVKLPTQILDEEWSESP